ncbi:trichohyalin-like [Argiope bruennichi]|uniref:trichohyalin-like n=1 Tax=Argiope bruennichi TaxID=94029 RepID=UPI00249534F2|nr:trichohyalin-like [Argiope bruennichi]
MGIKQQDVCYTSLTEISWEAETMMPGAPFILAISLLRQDRDLGFVYPGETLVLNMASFIALPLESLHYVWYMEKDSEFDALPSNMKSSPSGSVLTISELRKEQEGIMTCAVYSNLGILVAKKRFLIKELSSNDILMNPTNRSYSFQGKRNSQHSIMKRRKPEDDIEKSLKQLQLENSGLPTTKEGFEVDYNTDREESSFIDDLLESPPTDAHTLSKLFDKESSKSNKKTVKLPPPASAVKMDAIEQERKIRQDSLEFNEAQQQQQVQYQQQVPYYPQQQETQYQQQQEPQYQQQQESQYQQQQSQSQQSQYGQQQQPQYEQQQQPQYEQQQPQPQYEQQQQYEQQLQQYEQQRLHQEQLRQHYEQHRLQQEQQRQQYEQQLQEYEQKRLQQAQQQQYEQQRLQQEQQQQYEQQRLQQEQQQQYEQQRLQQEQQQRLQQEQQRQYEEQQLQQQQQQRLQQEQQQLQQEQRLQQEQQQSLQHERQERLKQKQEQRLQQVRVQLKQEQEQRLKQEQEQQLQQEQKQRLQQEQQQRLLQEQQRLKQEQQRLQKEQQEQKRRLQQEQQRQLQQKLKQGLEKDTSSEQKDLSAIQNLSPSLTKYSMGQIQQPKENEYVKDESFLHRQRHSTELISPTQQMARPFGKENYPSKDFLNRSPSSNFPAERKPMPFNQKEYSSRNMSPSDKQFLDKKTMPFGQKEFSVQNVPSGEDDILSPEIFIENKESRPEDDISKIISRCKNDRECAGNAACIKSQASGFCRCLPNFHGNGISCWEDMVPRKTRTFSAVAVQDRTNTGILNF